MRKIIAILLAAAFATTMVPTASAETVTRDYIGGLGASVLGVGPAVISCYEDGMTLEEHLSPECEVLRAAGYHGGVGGTDLISSGFYTNAIVSVADDTFGSEAAFSTCFYHPDGDFTCDGGEDSADGVQDYPGERGCGTQALLDAPFQSNFVTVFVFSVVVTEDLDVCGSSMGTASGDLF